MKPVGDHKIENPSPIAWTIAGSDSGGGAGIQADLKVMNAFGVHGCSVTTALTAQNTRGVQSTESVSESMLRAQLEALKSDLPPVAIKTGMLGSAGSCRIIADFLERNMMQDTSGRPTGSGILTPASAALPPVVCDPVLASTYGTELLNPEALDILVHGIFPYVAVLTPNIPETQRILGKEFTSPENAAEQFLNKGARSVLIKGGHAEGNECRDYWSDGAQSIWLSSPRIESQATHGTGCVLSAAIASAIALGQSLRDAVVTAKTFLNQCLRSPAGVGGGSGPMRIVPFEDKEEDRPTVQ